MTEPQASDPLADFRSLTDVALRRRSEPAHGLFIAEGVQVAARALTAGYAVRTLLVRPERTGRADVAALIAAVEAAGGQVRIEPSDVIDAATGFAVHRGVLASFARRALPTVTEVAHGSRTLAVLEGVVDHTNVGAVFRSAAALGVDGLVLDPRCADPLYRRAIRTSMGAVYALPYARCAAWPDGLHELTDEGFRLLALTPHDGAIDLSELSVGPDEKIGLLLGAEGSGLSPRAVALTDDSVAIRMSNGVDSLNVATAAALAFWAVEQARRP